MEVSLLEAGGACRSRRLLGEEVGRVLAERYRSAGVDLRTEARVDALRTTGRRPRALRLAGGTEVACDAALVAVGAEPAAELLGGEVVQTDACGRTAHPDVYACGDAAAVWRPSVGRHARTEHWTSAAAQGAAVARAILGRSAPADDVPYFWSDQFGLRLQHVGHGSAWDRVVLDGSPPTRSLPATTPVTAGWSERCSPTARTRSAPSGESSPGTGSPRSGKIAAPPLSTP